MEDYYRTRVEINLDHICDNYREIYKRLGDDTKLLAVIKADGYGHGAIPIAKVLTDQVYAFGVAIVEEAIELRKAGITNPILILGYCDESEYQMLLDYDIMPAVFTYPMAERLSQLAAGQGKRAKIHIKIDTSMNRIGFKPTDESFEVIQQIAGLDGIMIDGIFSHFARADETLKGPALKALDEFTRFCQRLSDAGIQIPLRHISNSAAIIDFEQSHFDMCRVGIITYGLYPSVEVNQSLLPIKSALEWKTHIIYIKEVPAGEGVSYNSTYVTDRQTKIATIPVGYADGYARTLSNKGCVLIRGQRAPIIGRICMDQFMVDVTEIDHVQVGDTVTLIGRDGEEFLPVEELGELSGRFNYEFVCDISKRVPRIYIQNNQK
ncbi:MAG: alanine racemase [Lachnospiraceae bacterium]